MHWDGMMAFAARQAALQQTLATHFRWMWWNLTNRITSSELSGINDHDCSGGSNSSSSEEEDRAGDDDGRAAFPL
jgi:hypothetical protein